MAVTCFSPVIFSICSSAAKMPSLHIGFEILVGVARVGIDPGDAEHGQALRHRPADEAFVRIEIEDVELVDPGRHDQQGPLVDLLGGRRILHQLDQVVAQHHLARRGGEIDAEFELAAAGLADADIAVAGLDVLGQHLHAAREIFAFGRPGRAQEFGIGQQEIRGRQGAGQLPDIEGGLVVGELVDSASSTMAVAQLLAMQ